MGAIDVHVHSIPDSETWRIDSIDVARLAKSRGMRGLVLKSHWESTGRRIDGRAPDWQNCAL